MSTQQAIGLRLAERAVLAAVDDWANGRGPVDAIADAHDQLLWWMIPDPADPTPEQLDHLAAMLGGDEVTAATVTPDPARQYAWPVIIAICLGLWALAGWAVAGWFLTEDDPAATITHCTQEDGSGPQTFPCLWDGGSNGTGSSYVLTEPVCTPAQVAVSDARHAAGLTYLDPGCDDLESQTGR